MKRTILLLLSVMMVNIMTVTAQSSIVTYQSDGTQTVVEVTSNFYAAPNGILAVDITGAGITAATSVESNCLFIIGEGDPAPVGVGNTIVKSGSSYTADHIDLTDGSDFYSPVDFTASNIEFTYYNDRWADGTNGWNTIMLPYDVSLVTADDNAIDWFHSSSDTDKQFWLKRFVSDEPDVVNFDFTDELKANTPYIIAFPGDHWGSEYDLSGKTLKFIGQDVTIHKSGEVSPVTGNYYSFIGDTKSVDAEDIYCLNPDGNKFDLDNCSAPFRAYFKANMSNCTKICLSIRNGGGTTGIVSISEESRSQGVTGAWYSLDGRKLDGKPTKKGIYVKNERKVVIE